MNNKQKKLKIGFVLDDTLDTPDGVQQYVITLGNWLTNMGHEVHYLVGESYRNDIDNVYSMARNVKVRFNKNRLSIPLPSSKKLIKQKLADLKFDVLHIQMPYSPLFAGRVIESADINTKVIGTFHIVPANWIHSAGAKSLHIMNKKTLARFNNIISVSSAAQDFAKSTFGIESTVIPNVVDVRSFLHKPSQSSKPKIVFLGRLVERKGCQYLLNALKRLQGQYKGEYEVIIAGKGPLREKLLNFTKINKLKNINFIGFVNEVDKPALLSSAQIAVFPSTGGESFGIVLIEAMAAGAEVVIGGNNIGYKTVLGAYPDLIIDPSNSRVFADRLQFFLEDKTARINAERWAQDTLGQYDVGVVGKKILNIYENTHV